MCECKPKIDSIVNIYMVYVIYLQSQMKDVAEDMIFQTNKKKIGVWKVKYI